MTTTAKAVNVPLPPLVPSFPFLGIATKLQRDPLSYFVKLYREYGPIFRVRLLGREITIMAGLEANQFMAREGDEALLSGDVFGDFAKEMGTDLFVSQLDGEIHRHMRKVMRKGYSREAMAPRLGQVVDITQKYTRAWRDGESFSVLPMLQHIVTNQLGIIIANRPPEDVLPDLAKFLTANLYVNVTKTLPRLFLHRPDYKRAKERIYAFCRLILEEHRANPAPAGKGDLIDDLLAAHDFYGKPFSEETLIAATIGPYIAGIDTVASSTTFTLYTVLRDPALTERILVEVDALFEGDKISLQQLKNAKTLHGAAMETMRMYPVAPFTPRYAGYDFEFAGYRIPKGAEVWPANGVTHYLEEYFPNPEHFDADRYQQGGKSANAFAPYTLGAHTCLGAGLADVQIMVTMATLLHSVRLEIDPPDFEPIIFATPVPNLGKRFKLRVIEQRH